MATEQLVRSEIDAGLELVRVLDQAGFGVAAALWLFSGETGTWRFVVATKDGKREVSRKYLEAATAISRWRDEHPNDAILELDRVRIVDAQDPLITGLAPIVKIDGLSEIRLSNNLINGVYVEDALIHRLAA